MNPQDAWNTAYHQLEAQLGAAQFNTWLRDAALLDVDGDVWVIGVRSVFARDMLEQRLYRSVRRVVSDVYGSALELRFEVVKAAPRMEAAAVETPLFKLLAQQDPTEPSVPLHQRIARPERPELPETELNPRFTLDRFIAGSENEVALAAAHAIVEQPAAVYNPFFVYGSVGLGKTHLLQGIAHACRARGLHVVYIPSEVFVNELIQSIRERTTAMFRERYRGADILLVDDIQFIGGKDSTQEEFFHTFNALNTFNKQVVIASDRAPRELTTLEDRLRSRFEGGLIVDMHAPGFETRCAILRGWAADRGVELPNHICEQLAASATTNVRELEGMFNHIAATSRFLRKPITTSITDDALESYRQPRYHAVTLGRVLETVAAYFRLRVSDLTGKNRAGRINQARQIAMYLARELTMTSLPQIGDAFGGRKHSTVLHSCNKVSEEMEYDPALRAMVADLRRKLTDE